MSCGSTSEQVPLQDDQIRILANLDAADLGFHVRLVGTAHGCRVQALSQGEGLAHRREYPRVSGVRGILTGNRRLTLGQCTHVFGVRTWHIGSDADVCAAIDGRSDWLEVLERPLHTDYLRRGVQPTAPSWLPRSGLC